MHLVQHIGAHVTDGERLIRSLMKNQKPLADHGVRVPVPTSYRRLLREAIQRHLNDGTGAEERDPFLDAFLPDRPERLVLSNPAFICTPNRIFEGREFYGLAGMKVRALCDIFAGDEVEIFLATRNPATFIPAVWEQSRARSVEAYLDGLDPRQALWSDVVRRIRDLVPSARLVVWANEDTPLIWGRLMRAMAGVPFSEPLDGVHDLVDEIMTEEGRARFRAYLRTHPPQSESQMSRVAAAFLDKYAVPEEVMEEVDMEGWDASVVSDLTRGYEADLDLIAGMDGVTVLQP